MPTHVAFVEAVGGGSALTVFCGCFHLLFCMHSANPLLATKSLSSFQNRMRGQPQKLAQSGDFTHGRGGSLARSFVAPRGQTAAAGSHSLGAEMLNHPWVTEGSALGRDSFANRPSPPTGKSSLWVRSWEMVGEAVFDEHAKEVTRPNEENPWILKRQHLLDFKGFVRAFRDTLDHAGNLVPHPTLDELDYLFEHAGQPPKMPPRDPLTNRMRPVATANRDVDQSNFVATARGWATAHGSDPQEIVRLIAKPPRRLDGSLVGSSFSLTPHERLWADAAAGPLTPRSPRFPILEPQTPRFPAGSAEALSPRRHPETVRLGDADVLTGDRLVLELITHDDPSGKRANAFRKELARKRLTEMAKGIDDEDPVAKADASRLRVSQLLNTRFHSAGSFTDVSRRRLSDWFMEAVSGHKHGAHASTAIEPQTRGDRLTAAEKISGAGRATKRAGRASREDTSGAPPLSPKLSPRRAGPLSLQQEWFAGGDGGAKAKMEELDLQTKLLLRLPPPLTMPKTKTAMEAEAAARAQGHVNTARMNRADFSRLVANVLDEPKATKKPFGAAARREAERARAATEQGNNILELLADRMWADACVGQVPIEGQEVTLSFQDVCKYFAVLTSDDIEVGAGTPGGTRTRPLEPFRSGLIVESLSHPFLRPSFYPPSLCPPALASKASSLSPHSSSTLSTTARPALPNRLPSSPLIPIPACPTPMPSWQTRAAFLFDLYDFNNSGSITISELSALINAATPGSVVEQDLLTCMRSIPKRDPNMYYGITTDRLVRRAEVVFSEYVEAVRASSIQGNTTLVDSICQRLGLPPTRM